MLALHCAEVECRWTHEYEASHDLQEFFWHAKDFTMSPEVDSNAGETQLGSYDRSQCAHECPDDFTMFYEALTITSKFWEGVKMRPVNSVSICGQLWGRVPPALVK